MIDRRTGLWGTKVVGPVRVEGKDFGLTGRVVRSPGYCEVYVGRKRDNRRSIEHREQYSIHYLSKMLAQGGVKWCTNL